MDSSFGRSYLHNQIQHKKLDRVVKTVSLCRALNSPEIEFIFNLILKIGHADDHVIKNLF